MIYLPVDARALPSHSRGLSALDIPVKWITAGATPAASPYMPQQASGCSSALPCLCCIVSLVIILVGYFIYTDKFSVPIWERGILLNNLKPIHIEEYYEHLRERSLSNNTIIRHHANIRKALQETYQKDLISYNPADRVKRPRVDDFISHPYLALESNQLLEVVKSEKIELVVTLALFYGLCRSEVLGLRWSAIDFERDTIVINHSIIQVQVDRKYSVVAQDKLKRTSSFRTLPLIPIIKDRLLKEKESRNPRADEYICVDEKGDVIKPNYVSLEFPKLLKRHGLRHIRFHDLRHSCANLLISQRVPLIEVQQWLGHSTISTTADLYAHLDFTTKINSADIIKKN